MKRGDFPPIDFPVYDHLGDTLPEGVWDDLEKVPYTMDSQTALTYLARRLNGETAIKDGMLHAGGTILFARVILDFEEGCYVTHADRNGPTPPRWSLGERRKKAKTRKHCRMRQRMGMKEMTHWMIPAWRSLMATPRQKREGERKGRRQAVGEGGALWGLATTLRRGPTLLTVGWRDHEGREDRWTTRKPPLELPGGSSGPSEER